MANHLPSSHPQPTPLGASIGEMPPLCLQQIEGRHRLCVNVGAIYEVLAHQPDSLFIDWFHQHATTGSYQYGVDYWFNHIPNGGVIEIWTGVDMAIALIQAHNGPQAEQLYQHFTALRAQVAQEICGGARDVDDQCITTDQARWLKELARAESLRSGEYPQTVWTAFQQHFEVHSYLKLSASRFKQACDYFNDRKTGPATPSQPSTSEEPWAYFRDLHHMCELKGLQKEADCITQTAFNSLEKLLGLL